MRVPSLLSACLLLMACVVGCSKKDDQAKQEPPQVARAIPIANPDDLLVRTASDKLCEKFNTGLRSELTQAISQTGPANALRLCGAYEMRFKKSLPAQQWAISRVSDKVCNRANRLQDSSLEARALRQFARDTSKHFSIESEIISGVRVFRYYKPIYVEQICLNCHGESASMDPQVISALASEYPDNQATGYNLGQLRGLYVVEAAWPQAKPYAEQLIEEPQH